MHRKSLHVVALHELAAYAYVYAPKSVEFSMITSTGDRLDGPIRPNHCSGEEVGAE